MRLGRRARLRSGGPSSVDSCTPVMPTPSATLPAVLPAAVRSAILTCAAALQQTGVVRTVAVYGGVARGRFVEGRSDVNLLVVLDRAERGDLQALAPILARAAGVRFEPMFVTVAELARLGVVFPIKFRDIQARHVVVAGDAALLAALQVPMTNARLRVEQELRNLALRSRRRFVELADRPPALQAHLAGLVRPLAIEVASLLAIDGHQVPEEDRTAAIFAQAAGVYGLDAALLGQLAELRQGSAGGGDPAQQFVGFLAILDRLAQRAGGAS